MLKQPFLARPRRRRVRKPIARPLAPPREPEPRQARAPHILTMSTRRVARRAMPEAIVPYLRMSGRWLEEHGFPIGSTVQVLVERGKVVLLPRDGRYRELKVQNAECNELL